MDAGGQSNLPEGHMSQQRSLGSNYGNYSKTRKVSMGVLVESVSKAAVEDLKEPSMQIDENEAYSKGNYVKDCEEHTPLAEKHVTVEHKDASPWVTTRFFSRRRSSSVAVQNTEHTPSFPDVSRRRPRSKLSEKASAAHSHKFFSAKVGLESDECRQKNSGKENCLVGSGKFDNAELAENSVCSIKPGVGLEKEQVKDKDRTAETGGRETLRMKLWEILGNVSPQNKHCLSPKSVELYPDQERERKQSSIEKINPNSDTIESDSQTPVLTRPMARSLTRRKASTKKQSRKNVAAESIHNKEGLQKRIFSLGGDWPGRLYDNFSDDSLPSKRNKTLMTNSRVKTCEGFNYDNAEERLQSDEYRSAAVEKSTVHRKKASNASSSSHRRNDVLLEPAMGTKNDTSSGRPPNVMSDHKDIQQPMNAEVSKKNNQEYISEMKSHDCLAKSKQGKLQDQSPAKKIFDTTSIRSFKSLFSPKSTEHKSNEQMEPSDDNCEPYDSPAHSFLVKERPLLDEDGENQMSKSSSDETDAESSEDKSDAKGCRGSEELSPEIFVSENILHGQNKSLGSQENGTPEMYLEQNQEDDLARAVALFSVALNRLRTKLKSISSRRSAEILRAAVQEIFLRLQNAESQIKKDAGKLTSLSHLNIKQLESRFQEQQEQLLGIYKRFKEEVDQHLQDYGKLVEDLEEHEIKLKGSVEKQRVAHKKFLARVEQEISVQLDGAESRIMAVQELAREKMLQLKHGVAECLKHGAFF